MKKILVGLIIGIFLIDVTIGMISMATGFLIGNFDMVGCGIAISLMSLLFPVALPMALEVTRNYLK